MSSISTVENYRAIVRDLSDRIVEAQRPIRILDAIKWDPSIERAFFESAFTELPPVDRAYYEARPLSFDPVAKRHELREIERDILSRLGPYNTVGVIMRRMCREYQHVVRLLESRGLSEFTAISKDLYGAASDVFHAGDPTLAEIGVMIAESLANLKNDVLDESLKKHHTSEEVVEILQERLNVVYPDPANPVRVMLSDGIISDAAAGTNYIKIRKDARFNERDIRLLEVHEGWVHVGTTLNGMNQPVCTFLSKGPPSATVTQEGLAILLEIIAFASHPARLRNVTNRIVAVDMAERGANFLEVFEFFRSHDLSESDSYSNAMRIFRGSTPDGGPFTKDIAYSKGFILTYNYIQLAVRKGLTNRIPLLFCGKTTLEDMRTLAQLVEEGMVVPPRYLPPLISDLNALSAWMYYSNILNRLNLEQVESDYANIL